MPVYQYKGQFYELSETDPTAAKAKILSHLGENTDRTWGEAASDVMASFGSGVGSVLQLPGKISGLVTGDMSETGLRGFGKDVEKYWEAEKSQGLKARKALLQREVQKAEEDGQLSAFAKSALGTITDPALLVDFLVEQAPQLIPMIASGVGVGALAGKGVMSAAAARGAAQEAAKRLAAKKATQAGTTAALQTGAVMQGADIGAGAYDEIVKELVKKGVSPEEAAAQAINKARAAGVTGYALSVLANRYLPGGSALEKILAGEKVAGNVLKRAGATALKEIPSENIEEVGGRIAQNIAAQQAGLDRDLLAGTGETAAQATLGAVGLGGVAGATARAETAPGETIAEPDTREESEIDKLKAAAEVKRAEAEAKRAEAEAKRAEAEAAKAAETPAVETPTTEAPAVETPTTEAPAVETPTTEAPAVEPTTEAPAVEPTTEPAETIEEPKVRKAAEAQVETETPAVGFTEQQLLDLGFTKKQAIFKRLIGKELSDPAVVEDIKTYLTKGYGPKGEAGSAHRLKLGELVAKPETPPATPAVETPQVTEAPRVESAKVEPEAGGAGVPVAGEPSAGPTAEGAGVTESVRVVPPVEDAGTPAGGEGQPSVAVTETPKAYVAPESMGAAARVKRGISKVSDTIDSEEEVDNALAAGLITQEQAETYRADLRSEEAPSTAMAAAFEKRAAEIKAEMDALRQKNGKPPAPKSKNRAKFDELQAQLDALVPSEAGSLAERVEKLGVQGVFAPTESVAKGTAPAQAVVDLGELRSALIKARAKPEMLKAVLTYIGVDEDGNYLPTTYSREEAAEMAGMARSSGANVSRVAEALGITEDVRRRFHAGQTDIIVAGKDVSEAGTGASVENPKPGLLYEAPKKPLSPEQKSNVIAEQKKLASVDLKTLDEEAVKAHKKAVGKLDKQLSDSEPKVVAFMRPALTDAGGFDFTKLSTPELAAIYSRASRFDAKDNAAVMQQLNAEVEARRKADRKGTDAAINRAYGKLVAEEEAQFDTESEEALETEEDTALEFEDATRRLSDEDTLYSTATGEENVDLAESKKMDDALRGKSFLEAVDFALANARDKGERAIMIKVRRRAIELTDKGFAFSFELTPMGKVLSGNRLGISELSPSGLGTATEVNVLMNGYTEVNPSSTLKQEILVHELLHAVTQAQIKYAPMGSAAKKLQNLQQDLVGMYNEKLAKGTLTEFEKTRVRYVLKNSDELLAYGLTDREVQNWLASIPSKSGKSFLSRLFDVVADALGIKGAETSSLAELLAVSEEVLDESLERHVEEANKQGLSFGKQANVTPFASWALRLANGRKIAWQQGDLMLVEHPTIGGGVGFFASKRGLSGITQVDIGSFSGTQFTPAELKTLRDTADSLRQTVSPAQAKAPKGVTPEAEAAAGKLDVIGEQERPGKFDFLKGNPALEARILGVDNMAGLDAKFAELYDGVRSKAGWLNPMVLMSRARDYQRFAKAVREMGGLHREQELIVPMELHNSEGRAVNYNGVLRDIGDEAKRTGKSFDSLLNVVDQLVYAHREYNLRERNREIEKQIADLEAIDPTKHAKKIESLRDSIITLKIKDDAKLDAAEQAFQNDEFVKRVSGDLDTIRFNLIDMLVEAGRISAEKAQEWKDATGYIPFQRLEEFQKNIDAGVSFDKGVTAMRNIRKLEGSERKVSSPVIGFSDLITWATKEAMFNDAAVSALEDLELVGAAKKMKDKPSFDSPGDLVKTVYKNGEPVRYYVADPLLYAGFTLKAKELTRALKLLQGASRLLRAGVTSLPPFAIKQVADDITRAYTLSGVKNAKGMTADIIMSFGKDWYSEVAKRQKSAALKDLSKHGLMTTFGFHEEVKVKNLLKEAGVAKEGLGSAILRVMEAGAKASDEAVRQGIFNAVLEQTKSEKFPKGDVAMAEAAAREIINFSRQGASETVQWLATAIPFFNAWAQGLDKLATAAAGRYIGDRGVSKGAARAMFFNRMAALTAIGVVYALMMQDDDEYQRLPDHVRDTNWILPGAKIAGSPVGIPIPGDLAFFFKAIPERVVRYIKTQGTKDEQAALSVVGELAKRGVDVFSSPNITPQVLRPLVENLTNYSWFLNRPLESQSQLQQRPYLREGSGTSDAMKVVARWLDDAAVNTGVEAFAVSPIKLENAIRGMFGTSAGLALSMADAMINPSRTDRPVNRQVTTQVLGASAFLKDPVGSRYLDLAYDLEKDVTQAANAYKTSITKYPGEAAEAVQKYKGLMTIQPAVNGIMEQVRNIEKQAKLIDADKTMPKDERRRRINDLRYLENTIAREAIRLRTHAMRVQQGLVK